MQSAKVLITDKLAPEGVKILKEAGFEVTEDNSLNGNSLKEKIAGYDALIVRSGTQATGDIIQETSNLKIIGRAGTGVDNIDITAATKKGIIVCNVPAGNTISACEHTLGLILSLARNIPQSHNSLKEGRWERKKYKGKELYGKTLGVVGMGKIGTEVVLRALAFKMDVIVSDPYITDERAEEIGVKKVSFEKLLKVTDIITVHVPVNDKTRGLFNKETISKMKKDSYLINCARGAIIDEEALAAAVKNGDIAGAAVDVFTKKPATDSNLINVEGIIHTPHLGASTAEAQKRVAIATAEQVKDYILDKKIVNAVNMIGGKIDKELKELGFRIGFLAASVAKNLTDEVIISYIEEIKDKEESLTRAVFEGFLSQFTEGVNFINAGIIAREKGIEYTVKFKSSVSVPGDIIINTGGTQIRGSIIGGKPRITGYNGYIVDVPLAGNLIIIDNDDVPGVIGKIGTVIGRNKLNIGSMEVGRDKELCSAVTIIEIDGAIPDSIRGQLLKEKAVKGVKIIKVGP